MRLCVRAYTCSVLVDFQFIELFRQYCCIGNFFPPETIYAYHLTSFSATPTLYLSLFHNKRRNSDLNYGPVDKEVTQTNLVVRGTLPADLNGEFVRNGPNNKFPYQGVVRERCQMFVPDG